MVEYNEARRLLLAAYKDLRALQGMTDAITFADASSAPPLSELTLTYTHIKPPIRHPLDERRHDEVRFKVPGWH